MLMCLTGLRNRLLIEHWPMGSRRRRRIEAPVELAQPIRMNQEALDRAVSADDESNRNGGPYHTPRKSVTRPCHEPIHSSTFIRDGVVDSGSTENEQGNGNDGTEPERKSASFPAPDGPFFNAVLPRHNGLAPPFQRPSRYSPGALLRKSRIRKSRIRSPACHCHHHRKDVDGDRRIGPFWYRRLNTNQSEIVIMAGRDAREVLHIPSTLATALYFQCRHDRLMIFKQIAWKLRLVTPTTPNCRCASLKYALSIRLVEMKWR